MSKTFTVKLVRDLKQSATITVDADSANGAVNRALDIDPKSVRWNTDKAEIHHYEKVEEQHPVPEEQSKSTVIYGYEVELELFEEDGDPRSDCSVAKTIRGIEFGGSLGMLMGFGTLEDYDGGEEYVVPERHQKAIIKWAEENGY